MFNTQMRAEDGAVGRGLARDEVQKMPFEHDYWFSGSIL